MTRMVTCIIALAVSATLSAQSAASPERLLVRRYVEGETFAYRMTGNNNDRRYEVRITGTVRKNAQGQFVDEFVWSDLVSDGAPRALRPEAQALRVPVTLEGGMPFTMPNLAVAGPLVGPITDMLTFYADLFLALHGGATLTRAGDHVRVSSPVVGSWAAGPVIIGEDSVDFDVTLTEVDRVRGIARLLIKHVVWDPLESTCRHASLSIL